MSGKHLVRTISLAVSVLFFSLLQSGPSSAAGEVDIASMDACPVSLQNEWAIYGAPHPCFTNGTALKIAVPKQRNPNNGIQLLLNGEVFAVTAGSFFTIPRYNLGLNEVIFKGIDANDGTSFEIKSTKFIIYQPVSSFRLRTLAVSKSSYVITIAEGITPDQVISAFGIQNNEYIAKSLKGSESYSEPKVLVVDLSPGQYSIAASSPLVSKIFPEGIVEASAIQSNATWGLDRIDQLGLPLDNNYKYDYTGAGVDVYIVDSGIREDHTEFTNRITATMFSSSYTSVDDCHGHGTHVTGTAAGSTYGVAKSANIIAVKALGCNGSGTISDIQAGVNWIISRHTTNTPAVVNFSLGSPFDSTMNSLVQSLIDDGIVTVVAAGNEADDACFYSPASAPNAITVGATTNLDQDSLFSNVGSCVDIFAPGTNITSAGIASSSATLTISGTSMASPHVAGAAALILAKDFAGYPNKRNANDYVRSTLLSNASPEMLRDSSGYNLWWNSTTNKLLNTSNFSSEPQSTLQITNGTLLFQKNENITLTSSGGSGTGAVIYRSQGSGCNISGSTMTISIKRKCAVTAIKASDETFTVTNSAYIIFSTEQPQASLVVTNSPASGTIGTPVTILSQGGSGAGAVTYAAVSGACQVVGGRLVAYGVGNCGVIATKAPDDTYIAKSSETSTFTFSKALAHGPWKSVSAGGATTCAITKVTEKLYCWGLNVYGQLSIPVVGAESLTAYSTPQLIGGVPGRVKSVSVGTVSLCAINEFADLYCWGNNSEGQLGNNSLVSTHIPELVSALSGNVKSVSVGHNSTCAVTKDSKAFCWGSGSQGQLGNETTTSSAIPVQVSGLTSQVSRVSVGFSHACAAHAGAIKCWGAGDFGALGNGQETSTASPVLATGLTSGFTGVSAGFRNSCAIGSGQSYCWGLNAYGAIGDGTTTNRLSATALPETFTVASEVSTKYGTTCAVTKTGSFNCWGYNGDYQTGTSVETSTNVLSAKPVLGLNTNVVSSTQGSQHSCALTDYGRIFCWGDNSYGQLGTGETFTSHSAIQASQLDYNLNAPLIPALSETTTILSSTSFGIQITNFDASYSWSAISSNESATASVSNGGVAIVRGLSPSESSTVTVLSFNANSETGTGLSIQIATMARGLLPIFDTSSAVSTADGFEISLSNYDASYQWSGVSSYESATVSISNLGRVVVSGVSPGTQSRVLVTSTKSGISDETSISAPYSSILGQGLLPAFDTSSIVTTSDGFRIRLSNHNPLYSWSAISSIPGASATVDSSGLITVTGVPSSTPSVITVTSLRNGYESLTAITDSVTSSIAPPPPAPPAPAPSVGVGGGGGVGTTWFNLFISNPDDPTLAFSGEACALFTLKSADGDKQFGPICAAKTGSLDFEANDGEYLIRTFDKAFPKYYKEYKAKITFGTFEVVGAGYRGGSVPRRVITVLKSSEFPVEQLVTPSPSPSPSATPTPTPTPEVTTAATPAPTSTTSPSSVTTMANNGLISTIAKTSSTKKVTLTSNKTALSIKKSATVALTVNKIPAKSSLSILVTLPTGHTFTAATIKSYTKTSYSMPALAFTQSGKFVIAFKIGKITKTVTIKVS